MLKEEFEALVGKEINDEDYKRIEFVYTWHPLIKEYGGKQQIADIYNVGGMLLIKDMMSTANKAMELDNKKQVIRNKMLELRAEQKALEDEFANYLWDR